MPFPATVMRVMIASPSDVTDARDAVERAVHTWNATNAQLKGVILLPWRWEVAAVPLMGAHPQSLINAQGVQDSDVVIALFGGRLGSPTPDAVSGTAEEIDKAIELGKQVHLYFSTAPLPHDSDPTQLLALQEFKIAARDRGLLGEFSSPEQLGYEVWKAIEHDVARLALSTPAAPAAAVPGTRIVIQPGAEREVSGVGRSGQPRYSTRRWIDVVNQGDVDAADLTIEAVGDTAGVFLGGPSSPTVIHAGQSRRFPVSYTMGSSDDPVVRVRWRDGKSDREQEFHIG